MNHIVDSEFASICRDIVAAGKTEAEWALIESDDMFHTDHYAGGFDADEGEFCFSVYRADGEDWFQISLAQAAMIADGKLTSVNVRPAG